MKKKIIIIPSVILCVLACLSGIFVFSIYTPKALLARLYTGDRVVVNLYATVDGKPAKTVLDNPVDLSEEEFFENANDICTLKDKNNYTKINVNTDLYGNGKIYLLLNEKYPICLEYYQFNWWDIQRINVYVDINSNDNLITYHYDYSYLAEDGKKIYANSEKQKNSLDSSNCIWIGRD